MLRGSLAIPAALPDDELECLQNGQELLLNSCPIAHCVMLIIMMIMMADIMFIDVFKIFSAAICVCAKFWSKVALDM